MTGFFIKKINREYAHLYWNFVKGYVLFVFDVKHPNRILLWETGPYHLCKRKLKDSNIQLLFDGLRTLENMYPLYEYKFSYFDRNDILKGIK